MYACIAAEGLKFMLPAFALPQHKPTATAFCQIAVICVALMYNVLAQTALGKPKRTFLALGLKGNHILHDPCHWCHNC